ncbi:MAG TPA: PACE efflux transporter [Rubrivivax sp.]|nr:PACE efflux transporter [Rubrivivax sp.]
MSARPPLLFSFQGPWRRVFYVGVYEALAIVVVTLALLAGRQDLPTASGLAIGSSAIAVTWNWVFNVFFERWEARQPVRGRSAARRIAHAIGFEGGLTIWLVPFMAWWLDVGLWAALLLDLAMLLFFLVYTFVFTWAFDRLFGLPAAAA